ncbi:hypothetical protein FF1_023713 [Malus domestica]
MEILTQTFSPLEAHQAAGITSISKAPPSMLSFTVRQVPYTTTHHSRSDFTYRGGAPHRTDANNNFC